MTRFSTLADVIDARRRSTRSIAYIGGESNERVVPYAELYDRALGLLRALQDAGASAQSELLIVLDNNEPLIDAFWACILGRIVPVPIALGNTDEHRFKFFRILAKLTRPYLITERKMSERLRLFAETE